MTIKEMILKQKGKWFIKYIDNYKLVVDLDKMIYDTYEWYKADGVLQQDLTNDMLNSLFINVVEFKRL